MNKQILERAYLNQLDAMNKNKGCKTSSKPSRMFVDGKFNKLNWNGGDDLIRDYFSDLENEYIDNTFVFTDNEGLPMCTVISNILRVDDTNIATILILDIRKNEDKLYHFEWYKNRGNTEKASLNNKVMNEDEYVELLSKLEETGYKFNI